MSSRPAARPALALAALALLAPGGAAALEPRFDHRDEWGLLAGFALLRDAATVTGEGTDVDVRPAVRLAYSFDVSGEGDELILGAAARLGGWSDPVRSRTLLAVDARYRGYFGTEELKTFFDAGLWTQVRSRFAFGPLVGLGVAYDPSRAWGTFVALEVATGFGAERVFSVGGTVGVQLRFE
jgi:hypothetical protein